jgi:hypothetical protein
MLEQIIVEDQTITIIKYHEFKPKQSVYMFKQSESKLLFGQNYEKNFLLSTHLAKRDLA